MKRRIRWAVVMALGLTFVGCEDIIEEDISGDIVTAVSPLDGAIIEGNTVPFQWNSLDGADEYNLQLYSNSQIVVDTLVGENFYNDVFDPGTYEWRVKGINNGYETQFNFPQSFELITSVDLSNQIVPLTSPSDNLYTNDPSVFFVWDGLSAATSYTFRLSRVGTSGNTIVYIEEGILGTSITLSATELSEDAEYLWEVKAVNDSSESDYTGRTLFLDTEAPEVPSLLTPAFEEEFVVQDSVNFSWNFPNGTSEIDSEVTSVLELSSTEDFSTVLQSESTMATNVSLVFDTSGTYYWRVRGTDEAGNVGNYNANGKFIVNE